MAKGISHIEESAARFSSRRATIARAVLPFASFILSIPKIIASLGRFGLLTIGATVTLAGFMAYLAATVLYYALGKMANALDIVSNGDKTRTSGHKFISNSGNLGTFGRTIISSGGSIGTSGGNFGTFSRSIGTSGRTIISCGGNFGTSGGKIRTFGRIIISQLLAKRFSEQKIASLILGRQGHVHSRLAHIRIGLSQKRSSMAFLGRQPPIMGG